MEKLYTKRFDTGTVCDVTEDFVLPDYIPEVRRVIGVRTVVSADGKYLSGDELETEGGVTYNIMYMDNEGAVCTTSQNSSYNGRIPLSGSIDDDDRFTPQGVVVSTSVDSVNCRVTAPRKLTLSSKVRIRAQSERPVSVAMKHNSKNAGSHKVRRRNEEYRTAAAAEFRRTGECGGEFRERGEMEVVMAFGELCLDGKLTSGALRVGGDAYVTAVMRSPEGAYVTSKSRVPVEEEITLPDVTQSEERFAAVFGNVVLLELESDDSGVMSWRMEYDIDCDIMTCGCAEYTADAYMTGCMDNTETASIEAVCPAGAVNGRLTTQTQLKLKPGMTYVASWGRASAEKCEITDSRCVISGSAYISVVEAGGGEAVLDEAVIPFRYEFDGYAKQADFKPDGRVEVRVTDIQAHADGESLGLTAELSVAAMLLCRESVRYVSAISAVEDAPAFASSAENMIRIYSPDDGETAWDVEKRFRLGREPRMEGEIYII